jgi:hypothetical protein
VSAADYNAVVIHWVQYALFGGYLNSNEEAHTAA